MISLAIDEIVLSEANWRATRLVVELAAVSAGALSGCLHGIRRDYDIVGVTLVALATGLGGGMARDALLGHGPALALASPVFLIAALIANLIGMLLGHGVQRLSGLLWTVDALSLGLFTVSGIQRAEEVGVTIVPALFLGLLTGTGGGLIRDVLCREVPTLLVPGGPYASAAILGGVVYYVALRAFGWPRIVSELLAALACFGLRALGTWRGWVVPRPHQVFRWPKLRGPPP